MRLITKSLPQLELGDTVNVNLLTEQWLWWIGKQDVYLGDQTLFLFDAASIPISNIVCNVIGIEINVMDWEMYVKVKEI
jgi:hypothetical protein